jgi:type II secretory pathway pseudopilin PulG
MIVVMIIGALSAVALPIFANYQLKAKTAEGKTNIGAIRLVEEAYYSEFEVYLPVAPEPATIPGKQSGLFDGPGSDFASLGFDPEGQVFFSYGVAVSGDKVGYTIDAGADLDANGIVQFWGYAKPDGSAARVDGAVGCLSAGLSLLQAGPCDPTRGSSVF